MIKFAPLWFPLTYEHFFFCFNILNECLGVRNAQMNKFQLFIGRDVLSMAAIKNAD